MWSDVITLIATNKGGDGWQQETETGRRNVFANKKSVGYSEFYQAAQAGYCTVQKFDIYTEEYAGEEIAEHNEKRYRILRTWTDQKNPDITEITLSDLSERMEVF